MATGLLCELRFREVPHVSSIPGVLLELIEAKASDDALNGVVRGEAAAISGHQFGGQPAFAVQCVLGAHTAFVSSDAMASTF
jgi:hypothetical protein